MPEFIIARLIHAERGPALTQLTEEFFRRDAAGRADLITTMASHYGGQFLDDWDLWFRWRYATT